MEVGEEVGNVNAAKRIGQWVVLGGIVSASFTTPTTADGIARAIAPPPLQYLAQRQTQLTNAEVYRLRNNVQLLLHNQAPRPARVADTLRPLDSLRTARASIAELLFNEGSIARVDQNTTFRFTTGLRRFQLPNLVAMNETIFELQDGTALIISPAGSVGTQIRTPDATVTIFAPTDMAQAGAIARGKHPTFAGYAFAHCGLGRMAQTIIRSQQQRCLSNAVLTQPRLLSELAFFQAQDSDLLPAPDRSNVAMVSYDAGRRTTQVFALTDGVYLTGEGNRLATLKGGQTVAIVEGKVGRVQEFDLRTFYQSVPLAVGLGPGQAEAIAQDPPAVQATINAVRPFTLAAVTAQNRRLDSFATTFLRDALSGTDSDFDGQRGRPAITILNPQVTLGTFVRTGETTGVFVPDGTQTQIPIAIDYNNRTISINGESGISNSAGLSGNNAAGVVILPGGRVIRVEVFGTNGEEPPENVPFRGSLTTGIAPDR